MKDTADQLLHDAEKGEEGRRGLFSLSQRAKELADAAVYLALQSNKFARDENVSCDVMAFDTDAEHYIAQAMQAAEVAVSQARETVTALYIAKLKETGRVK